MTNSVMAAHPITSVAVASKTPFRRKLVQSFGSGVMMIPVHEGSLKGNSFHNYGMKMNLLCLHREVGCLRLLQAEDSALEAAIGQLGIKRHQIIPDTRLADDTFVCDSVTNAVKRSQYGDGFEMMVVCPRMGAVSRRGESPSVIQKIEEIVPTQIVHSIEAPAKLESGDLLPIEIGGKIVLLAGKRGRADSPNGLSVRTNSEGRKKIDAYYQNFYGDDYLGMVRLRHNMLHLGTAMEIFQVGENEDVIIHHNSGLLDPEGACQQLRSLFKRYSKKLHFRTIKVPEKESWGAPVLAHEGKVICDERFEKIARNLKNIGFEVILVPALMHQGLDGNFRCKIQPFTTMLSCSLPI